MFRARARARTLLTRDHRSCRPQPITINKLNGPNVAYLYHHYRRIVTIVIARRRVVSVAKEHRTATGIVRVYRATQACRMLLITPKDRSCTSGRRRSIRPYGHCAVMNTSVTRTRVRTQCDVYGRTHVDFLATEKPFSCCLWNNIVFYVINEYCECSLWFIFECNRNTRARARNGATWRGCSPPTADTPAPAAHTSTLPVRTCIRITRVIYPSACSASNG